MRISQSLKTERIIEMIKNSVVALFTAAALAGVAMPAMAATTQLEASINNFDADYVQYQLEAQGVNTDRVEQWGEYVRAFVTGPDGRVTMQLFHADTLAPANI
jgi:hypothetical protein